jgi:hypothetical protein
VTSDTPNHNYNRPSQGTKNWHVSLNENFGEIDTDVEIRDEENKRSQYTPKQNAKFLATDTGAVYIGDGSEWHLLGSLDASAGNGGRTADGTVVAPPGEVQSTIDDAATNSEFGKKATRTVTLVSGTTYEVPDTVTLKPGIRLECNGARVVPKGDFDVFELTRDTQLIEPHVDTRDRNWSSTQVVVGADEAKKVEAANRAWVRDAYLLGDPGDGIGLQFRGGNRAPCSMQVANGTINGFDRALDFHATGSDTGGQGDWSNGNQFFGNIRNYRVGISMRSKGAAVSGNVIRVQAQANNESSEWLWKMDADPRAPGKRDDNRYTMKGNTVVAHPWDTKNYEKNNPYYKQRHRGAPVWFIGEGTRYGNSLYDLSGTLANQFVVNNSDNPSRNGIFTGHGGFVVGTNKFNCSPTYKQNDSRNWHPGSEPKKQ